MVFYIPVSHEILRTANIYDRIKTLKQKSKLSASDKHELAHLQERVNFIMNPNNMNPADYALNKGLATVNQ